MKQVENIYKFVVDEHSDEVEIEDFCSSKENLEVCSPRLYLSSAKLVYYQDKPIQLYFDFLI